MDKQSITFFRNKNIKLMFVFLGVVIIYLISSFITEFDLAKGVIAFPEAADWMIHKLVPDAKAWERFPRIVDKLFETALLSTAATVVAAIAVFPMSLLGSRATGFQGWVNQIVRMIAAFFRNVPDVVWAMLLMFSFGQNILTGFFALFFTTFGLLTRAFIETIDEVSADCVEALEACGGNFLQIVAQGIIPSTITGIITWVLYMIETNIRSSTLIGILTATGIGYLFDMYYKRLEFGSASLVVVSIVVLVIIIENISNYIRKVIK
ncbi:MAG: ABC transporter permease subunit [Roseburia sp.]